MAKKIKNELTNRAHCRLQTYEAEFNMHIFLIQQWNSFVEKLYCFSPLKAVYSLFHLVVDT